MDSSRLSRFVSELVDATTLDVASTSLLRELVARADELLDGEFKGLTRRATLHVRPDDTYRSLLVFEVGDEVAHPVSDTRSMTSTAAWHLVRIHARPACIDVPTASISLLGADGFFESEPIPQFDQVPSQDTLDRLTDRGATHVLALPIRAPGSSVIGMVSVEIESPAATGRSWIWEPALADFELLARIASPYLLALPDTPGPFQPDDLLPVVGKEMSSLIALTEVFAQQNETMLIIGPTGTGKSRLARWCHARSGRREKPFVTLDLLSVPEETQMAELVGWKRGAFTGATHNHAGAVESAQGGTLFIDEIDKLSRKAQAGLLYLLEERRFRPLGGNEERDADVRFVVGTNGVLSQLVRDGLFREDLYFRVNVLAVGLPPLDARRDEIGQWAQFMAERRHKEAGGTGQVEIVPEGLALLEQAQWPGNLRQLDNVVRRAYVIATATPSTGRFQLTLDDVRRALSTEMTTRSEEDPFRRVAEIFVERAMASDSKELDVDLLAGVKGVALLEAIRRSSSREEAFALLGKGNLLKGRNHHGVLKRELQRTIQLYDALGIEPDPLSHELLSSSGELGPDIANPNNAKSKSAK